MLIYTFLHKRCKIINNEFVKHRIRLFMSQFETLSLGKSKIIVYGSL
jgi:hypothetical protein